MGLHQMNGFIDAADWQHTHRTARAMHEPHILRHQILHTVTEDGVGVAATELHQMVFPALVRRLMYAIGQLPGQLVLAEFVHIFHGANPAWANSWRVFSASSSLTLFRA